MIVGGQPTCSPTSGPRICICEMAEQDYYSAGQNPPSYTQGNNGPPPSQPTNHQQSQQTPPPQPCRELEEKYTYQEATRHRSKPAIINPTTRLYPHGIVLVLGDCAWENLALRRIQLLNTSFGQPERCQICDERGRSLLKCGRCCLGWYYGKAGTAQYPKGLVACSR